jgi:hypothetical protein
LDERYFMVVKLKHIKKALSNRIINIYEKNLNIIDKCNYVNFSQSIIYNSLETPFDDHLFATGCHYLFKRILNHNNSNEDLIELKKLCSIMFFNIMGYRIEDYDNAPNILNFFISEKTEKEILKKLKERKYNSEKEKEYEV